VPSHRIIFFPILLAPPCSHHAGRFVVRRLCGCGRGV
jgi:hypothetical protein